EAQPAAPTKAQPAPVQPAAPTKAQPAPVQPAPAAKAQPAPAAKKAKAPVKKVAPTKKAAPPPPPAEPAVVAPPSKAGVRDDFTVIRGIGPGMQRLLNQDGGIYTFAQLAHSSPDALRQILGDGGRLAQVEKWIEQARQLAEPA
ncbi:MAG: hypothetical protein KKB13_14060, partial [Chloroflexi bacterium]|nr:hypothetical protein [Chloroflexota bacterium]